MTASRRSPLGTAAVLLAALVLLYFATFPAVDILFWRRMPHDVYYTTPPGTAEFYAAPWNWVAWKSGLGWPMHHYYDWWEGLLERLHLV